MRRPAVTVSCCCVTSCSEPAGLKQQPRAAAPGFRSWLGSLRFPSVASAARTGPPGASLRVLSSPSRGREKVSGLFFGDLCLEFTHHHSPSILVVGASHKAKHGETDCTLDRRKCDGTGQKAQVQGGCEVRSVCRPT